MKKSGFTLFLSISSLFFFTWGCEKTTGPEDGSGVVLYSNSFETAADTIGWGPMSLRTDVPPGGGRYSVFISGGCVDPHASFKIEPIPAEGQYVLRCWGKNLGNGGMVGLGFEPFPYAQTASVFVTVNDSAWTFRQFSNMLYCPAGSTLWIWMISGGYVASAMLVDKVEVVRVE